MTSYVTPKKNTAFKLYVALVDQSNTKLTKANPTIAAGDFKVSTDGGAFANLATLPSANPASGRAVMIDLSAGEMNGDNIVVQCVDAAGAEWCDLVLNIQTTARQIDDLAFPATSGRSMVVDASGLVDANAVKVGPTGTGTAQTAGDLAAMVTAVDDYVDTEVAAIKAKTDNLPASPAAVGSAMTLTAAYDFAKGTAAMAESYNADGAAPTPAQALMLILQMLTDKSVAGTTLTVFKLDGTTSAATFTLNDGTSPTAITRAT